MSDLKKKVNCAASETIRAKIAEAFALIADPVAKTLGPGGQNVLLNNIAGRPIITKDGVTVAESISLEDSELDLIASIIKEAANKTNREAGDGTTTSTVLAHELYKEGVKLIAAGYQPVEIQRQILIGLNKISAALKLKVLKPEGSRLDLLKKVAAISMNGDIEVSSLVAEAVDAVGLEGSVVMQGSKDQTNSWHKEKGVKIGRGWSTPSFKSDVNDAKITFDNPYIFITSHDLESAGQMQDLLPALQKLAEARRPLLIISSKCQATFLGSLIANQKNGTLITCPILPPYYGIVRYEFYRDLAALTGARVIDKDAGDQLGAVKLEHFGQADRIEISAHDTIIIGGKGKHSDIEKRISILRDKLTEDKYRDIDKAEERLAKLIGGIGIVQLSYLSEVELEEKRHRVEDASHACRAALEEGVVAGGGASLYRSALQALDVKVPGEKAVLASTLNVIKRLSENIGQAGEVIAHSIANMKDDSQAVDLRKGELVDALKVGILDPVKVVRTALMNGGSVAAALLTTGAIISEIPAKGSPSFLDPYNPT